MKKSRILSSALVMTMVSLGAYAADEMITGGAGTCTVDVLGVSDNNATANTIAVWSINEYTLAPGKYLNVTETSVDKTTCPAGSYCVGGAGFTVDNAATSIAQCPAEYPNSATGAGAQNQCYTTCTVATANIAHATAVGGNDYFGDGADACYATACDTGYHVDSDVELVEQTPLIPANYETAGNGNYAYIEPDGSTQNNGIELSELSGSGTYAVDYDYGRVYGRASCQPSADPAYVYVMNNMGAVASGSKTMDELRTELTTQYGQAKANSIMDFFELTMSGAGDTFTNEANFETFAKMSVMLSESSDKNYSTDSTGQYCYCQMDGFAPATDGVLGEKTSVTSAPWVFVNDLVSADNCVHDCADNCADLLQDDGLLYHAFRAALFGAFEAQISGTCAANTINIDWNPDNGGDHTKNMCTYDGSITLPTPDPVKPGYTFTGWKLVEKTTTTE